MLRLISRSSIAAPITAVAAQTQTATRCCSNRSDKVQQIRKRFLLSNELKNVTDALLTARVLIPEIRESLDSMDRSLRQHEKNLDDTIARMQAASSQHASGKTFFDWRHADGRVETLSVPEILKNGESLTKQLSEVAEKNTGIINELTIPLNETLKMTTSGDTKQAKNIAPCLPESAEKKTEDNPSEKN